MAAVATDILSSVISVKSEDVFVTALLQDIGIVIYDESSAPSADDDIIDVDHSTLSFDPEALDGRLSTGYPIETYL